jgi:hypothetical protein
VVAALSGGCLALAESSELASLPACQLASLPASLATRDPRAPRRGGRASWWCERTKCARWERLLIHREGVTCACLLGAGQDGSCG